MMKVTISKIDEAEEKLYFKDVLIGEVYDIKQIGHKRLKVNSELYLDLGDHAGVVFRSGSMEPIHKVFGMAGEIEIKLQPRQLKTTT